ncbi:hypothetical protein ISN45_Aa05g010590, partial [Arabidopsis thaliana x Arabidopsis arenosa]
IKKNVASYMMKTKYDIHGFPLALHIWILESIPMLQTAYSRISLIERPTAFLCEKYTSLPSPQLSQIQNIEVSNHLNVFCILPSIPDDPEDKVSLEDEDDPELSLLVELLGKGYKMKSEDWTKRTLDVGAVIEEVAMIQCHSMRIEDFSKLCDQDS